MIRIPVLLLPLVLCTACGTTEASAPEGVSADAHAVLTEPETFEILSLHPSPHEEAGAPTPADDFHGYKTLGRAAVDEPSERRRIVELLYRGIRESDGSVAACFNPRHGIHAEAGGRSVDFVICYECLSMFVYEDGAERESLTTAKTVEAELGDLWADHDLSIYRGF